MKTKKIPMRRCLGCQISKPQKELIRVVRTPEGLLCVDSTGKMNGRGAYICRAAHCLEEAKKSRRLERQFDMKVSEELFKQIYARIEAGGEKDGGESHGK